MKNFLKYLFNKSTTYIVKTRIGGLRVLLASIFSNGTVTYERLDHVEDTNDRSNGWYIIELTMTHRNIKKLIKEFKKYLSWGDLIDTTINEVEGKIDLMEKCRRAK